jgi:hypothetical protein
MAQSADSGVTSEFPKRPSIHKPNFDVGSTIEDTIIHPGAVRINVRGAFIVDEAIVTPQGQEETRPVHDTGDIRLPHHTAVVSHVAVDVRTMFPVAVLS